METKARELDGKVLFSCVAAEAGYGVIIGYKTFFKNLENEPRGVLIGKSVFATKSRLFRRNRKIGNRVVAWCEEGLVVPSVRHYVEDRISPECLAEIDSFIAWGPSQAEGILTKFPDAPIAVCGNPRMDALRPEFRESHRPEANRLQKEYGEFVLINTNFGLANHYLDPDERARRFRDERMPTSETESYFASLQDFKSRMYECFRQMLRELGPALRDRSIIVRPHPSEDCAAWKRGTRDLGNVKVVQSGGVAAWMMAADAVVHNGCTTGLEAYLLGRPVVAYRPFRDPDFDSELPNRLGREATTPGELAALLREIIAGKEQGSVVTAERQAVLERHLAGLRGPLASELILAELDELDVPEQTYRGRLLGGAFRRPNSVPRSGYQRQKFPGLTLDEVRERVARLQQVSGRFKGVRVRQIEENCFCLSE